jgi:hypothetical protein
VPPRGPGSAPPSLLTTDCDARLIVEPSVLILPDYFTAPVQTRLPYYELTMSDEMASERDFAIDEWHIVSVRINEDELGEEVRRSVAHRWLSLIAIRMQSKGKEKEDDIAVFTHPAFQE